MRTAFFATASLLASASFAADIHVQPGQSIQAAITSAQDGDRVLVHPGLYAEALDFGPKRIELIGIQGAAVTTIDATGIGSSAIRVTHANAAPPYTRIEGLTITGGSGSFANDGTFGGGGIIVPGPAEAGVIVESCVITNNHVGGGSGGGILLRAGWCQVKHSTIDGNSAANGGGTAGTGTLSGIVMLLDSVVSNNLATQNGGGSLHPWSLERTTFIGNSATNGGGAFGGASSNFVSQYATPGTAGRFCRFVGNSASNLGGGLVLDVGIESNHVVLSSGVRTLQRCVFEANSAAIGGGAYLRLASVSGPKLPSLGVTNCVFSGNVAPTSDGVHVDANGFQLQRGFVDFSTFDGDGVGGAVTWVNGSILRNVAQPFAWVSGSPPTVWNSNVQGGNSLNGNIDVDPQWIGPGTGNHELPASSPCVDQVPPGFTLLEIETDLDGSPRYFGGSADMGAIEIGADCDGDGVADTEEIGSGTATDCDFDVVPDNCQPFIDCDGNGASDICQIAAGLASDCDGNGVIDSCEWSDCNGNGILDACDIKSFVELDCNSNGVPDSCEALSDCDADGISDACELASGQASDCNGNGVPDACDLASGSSADLDGNGLLDECQNVRAVPSQYPTIQAAIDAASYGDFIVVASGTYSGPGNVQLDLKSKTVTIRGASSSDRCILDGQGLPLVLCDSSSDRPTFQDLTFTGGQSVQGGAVAATNGATPKFDRCVFVDNASTRGGAVAITLGAKVTFQRCRFIDNVASTRGGAVFVSDAQSEASFEHSSFVGNVVTQIGGIGGSLAAVAAAKVTVTDSILWSNSAFLGSQIGLTGPGIGAVVTVTHCDVEGGQSGVFVGPGHSLVWSSSNLAKDPQFVDLATRDLHLTHTSPCRDAGSTSWAKDNEGDAQVGAPDIGADEFAPHAYTTGEVSPGQSITLRVIGAPGSTPVFELFGTTLLASPTPTLFGSMFAGPPFLGAGPFVLPQMPASGVIGNTITVPASTPVGLTFYRQAVLGAPESTLTNLDVITIVP